MPHAYCGAMGTSNLSTSNLMNSALNRFFRMPSGRYWEIDTWRGIVVITMIIFHLMWDLVNFQVSDAILYAGFWKYFQRFTACSFVFLAGVSLAIVYQRKPEFSRYLKRGLYVFGCGMLFSLAVLFFNIGYVHFGVLHMIGVSSILAYPLLRYKWLNVFLWFIFYIIGGIFLLPDEQIWSIWSMLNKANTSSIAIPLPDQVTWWLRWMDPDLLQKMSIQVNHPWLVWLGITPPRYYPVDFFPLFPYFGLVLLGVAVGNMVYSKNGRAFSLPDLSELAPIRFLRFLGSHSLPIYMIHQPVLFVILMLLGIVKL